MNLRLIQFGKSKDAWLLEALAEYQKRLQAFCKLEILELPDESLKHNPSPAQVMDKEAVLCLQKLNRDDYLILLDERGQQKSSLEFSSFLTNISDRQNVVFVIGGVFGTSEVLKARADFLLSLSAMTFTHRFARLILIEQVYRAMMIKNNRSYHY
ncbi:MAG: 23S rRNA (pseudouridine(1915)-N(3))-methyltransferase RlmH [Candidatus Cloacimonadota bacterium]